MSIYIGCFIWTSPRDLFRDLIQSNFLLLGLVSTSKTWMKENFAHFSIWTSSAEIMCTNFFKRNNASKTEWNLFCLKKKFLFIRLKKQELFFIWKASYRMIFLKHNKREFIYKSFLKKIFYQFFFSKPHAPLKIVLQFILSLNDSYSRFDMILFSSSLIHSWDFNIFNNLSVNLSEKSQF